MPRRTFTPEELQELRDLAAGWGKIVARRVFGDDGPDLEVDLDLLEQVAQAAAAGLNEGTLQLLLQRQAARLGQQQICPGCGRPCPVGREPRPLAGKGGTIQQDEPVCHCPDCRRDFFPPQRTLLRLDAHGYSPAVLRTIVTAAARLPSFDHAAFAVGLTGLSISPRHVQSLTAEVGAELARQRDDRAEQRRKRRLVPRVAAAPEAVAVEVDGGRLRTRVPGRGPGVHDKENKENKVACLVTLRSDERTHDPCPEPPPSFLQPRRVQRLVSRMGGLAGDATQVGPEQKDAETGEADAAEPEVERWSPVRLVRTCVASMVDSRAFGPLMAGEAQSRDFYAAKRRAFVADGQAYNWSIHRGYFADFEPIVDLLHVVCYLFTAAQALGGDEEARWGLYAGWLRRCWQGRASEVLADLSRYQEAVGRPPPGEERSDRDPRQVLAETLGYLRNNQARMDYPRYRRMGLPTTSSLVESLVGEFNARVKDNRKFWNRPQDAEAILQVRAALLSEDDRLERYFAERPGCPYRRRSTAHRTRNPRRAA